MDYIRKIPLLLGAGAGLIIGLIGLSAGVPNKENMLNMCVGMVIFYMVGILIRSTVKGIAEQAMEMIKKKEEEEKRREKEKNRIEDQKENEESLGASIDMTVGDESELPDDDNFDDLPIAEFIKNELE
jgi:divalent metal cation (Fe/Co/Zn/Cd) transporter